MRAKFGRGAVRRRGPTVKYIIGRITHGLRTRGRADEECDTE